MATARYTKVKLFEQPQWIDECPVVLEKAALLHDNKTDELLFQFKFTNIDTKTITAMVVNIECYDIGNNILDTVNHHFLDLKVLSGNGFADNEAVKLSFKETRGFKLSVAKVYFEDGEEWSNGGVVFRNIESPKLLDKIHINKEQLKYELASEHIVSELEYLPENHGTYWSCTCGCINKETICIKCHTKKDRIMTLLPKCDKDFLNARYNERIKSEREENERQQRIKKQEKVARNKKIVKVLIATLLIFAFIIVNMQVIIPFAKNKYTQYQYKTALKMGDKGDYSKAILMLEKLGEYEDSKERIEEFELQSKYVEAVNLGEYKKAIQLLEELKGYNNSEEMIIQQKYNLAQKYIDEEQYLDAEELYEQLGEYEDAEEKMREAGMLYTKELFYAGEYEEAMLYYEKYGFSDENYKECCYNVALDKQKNEDYKQALEYWKKAEGYKDSSDKLTECESEYDTYKIYMMAVSSIGAGDAIEAKEILTQLSNDYKNVEDLIVFCDEYKYILGKWIKCNYSRLNGSWVASEETGVASSIVITWVDGQWYVDGNMASFTNDIFEWSNGSGQQECKFDVTTGKYTKRTILNNNYLTSQTSVYKKAE